VQQVPSQISLIALQACRRLCLLVKIIFCPIINEKKRPQQGILPRYCDRNHREIRTKLSAIDSMLVFLLHPPKQRKSFLYS
jgi:hypothetical protein